MKSVSEILASAAAMGERYGVTKNRFVAPDGSMCLNGLLAAAILDRPLAYDDDGHATLCDTFVAQNFLDARNMIAKVIIRNKIWSDNVDFDDLAYWNNQIGVTGANVIAVLKTAAETAEA